MTDRDPVEVASFDAEPILAVLERHGVEYVIVGGYAARMHGSTRPTRDVDVAPATTVENLERLAAALRELDARIRTDAVPDGLPFTTSGESLVGQRMLNLQTQHGELDLTIRPAGFEGGYDELVARSLHRSIYPSARFRYGSPRSRTSSAPRRPLRGTIFTVSPGGLLSRGLRRPQWLYRRLE